MNSNTFSRLVASVVNAATEEIEITITDLVASEAARYRAFLAGKTDQEDTHHADAYIEAFACELIVAVQKALRS